MAATMCGGGCVVERGEEGMALAEVWKKLLGAVFRSRYYAGAEAEERYHAGAEAEEIFERQARAETPPWPMERISQDKEGISAYKDVAGGSVKRGDFICRRGCHAEVEVKCKTKYGHSGDYYYLLEYSEIMRHERMKGVTNAPVVFAFYEREGRSVLVDTLRMIDLDFLRGSQDYKEGKLYVEKTKCIKVPFRYTREGFEVLDILSKRRSN